MFSIFYQISNIGIAPPLDLALCANYVCRADSTFSKQLLVY